MSDAQPPTVPEPPATLTFSTQTDSKLPTTDLQVLPEVPGYQVVRMVGRGGMGIVYEARDKRLNRTVALKMILLGPHASEKDRARFRQEAESVAQLQHPGIVQIYEIGESGTGPFLALEYVPGGSLSDKLDGKPWPALAAAELVEQVTRAVEAAHQSGIIHRDLKPANILLTEGGSRSADSHAESPRPATPSGSQSDIRHSKSPFAKITDFGLAKRVDSGHGHTASGAILGTPSYMAPEQAEGRSSAISPATDVYALGAVLYELLTGRPPFSAETAFDTIMQVTRQDPTPPSRLNPKVPADLDTICLKCLRKEKERRYLSATALAEDLRRFREGRPIAARRIGSIERGWRWCRRNPLVTALLTAVAALLIAGTSVATHFAIQANEQWKEAQHNAETARFHAEQAKKNADAANAARREADRRLYAAQINLAQNALRENRLVRLRELLQETTPRDGAEDHRGWEWHYLHHQSSMESSRRVLLEGASIVPSTIAFATESPRCAAVYLTTRANGTPIAVLIVHDFETGSRLLEIPQPHVKLSAVALSSDGKRLAESLTGPVRIWDVDEKSPKLEIPLPKGTVAQALAFDESGKRLAISAGSDVRIVDAASNKLIQTIRLNPDCFAYRIVFDDRNARLYVGQMKQQAQNAYDSEVLQFDFDRNKLAATTGPMRREMFVPFAVNRSGNLLAVSQGNKRVAIWDAGAEKVVNVVPVLTESVTSMRFLRQNQFAVGGINGLISIYEAYLADEPVVLRGHAHPVDAIAVSATGHYVSLDAQAALCKWDPFRVERQRMLSQGGDSFGLLTDVKFCPSGRLLAHVGGSGLSRSLKIWELVDNRIQLKRSLNIGRGGLGTLVGKAAISRDQSVAAAVLIRRENSDVFGTGGILPGLAMRFGGPSPLPRALLDVGVRVFASDTEVVRFVSLRPPQGDRNASFANIKLPEAVHQLFLSANGRQVLTAGSGWRVHETATGNQTAGIEKQGDLHSLAAVHPDGLQYAVAVSASARPVHSPKDQSPKDRRTASILLRTFDGSDERPLSLRDDEKSLSITQLQFSNGGGYIWAIGFDANAEPSNGSAATCRLLVWKCDERGDYPRVNLPAAGRLPNNQDGPVIMAIDETHGMAACAFLTGAESAETRVWKLGADSFDAVMRFQSIAVEFAGFSKDDRRLLVASSVGGSDSSGAYLHVFDLASQQELLEIPLGRVIGAPGGGTGYHFDGRTLRAAAWNDKGAEMRVLDGAPFR